MPGHRIHRKIEKLLLGEEMEKIHKILDGPYFLHKEWRKLTHTIPFLLYLLNTYGEKAAIHAALHIILDEIWKRGKLYGKDKILSLILR